MPQGRYRSRSRSMSPRKKGRRRRSSDSSYSRSRSRSRSSERRFSRKQRSTHSSYSKQSSSRDRSRQKYEGRSHHRSRSRSSSSSPRRRRSHDKKDQSPMYAVESVKVLGRSFNEIPGLDFITQSGMSQRGKKERSYSPPAQRRREQKSTQDLDMRLRELEAQQTSDGSRSRPVDQPKDVQRGYYDSDKVSQQGYQPGQKSPVEQKYPSSGYPKQRPMSPDDNRYREQRSDVGVRVEMRGKQSPKNRKFDPSLVVIPRRKDEGLIPIFSRPEIIVRTLEDDPELYPEKYERFAAWREKPARGADVGNRKGNRDYSDRGRSRKSSSLHKEKGRSASPQHLPPRETTVTMKPFSIFEKFERSLQDDQVQREISDRQYLLQQVQQSSLPLQPSTSSFNSSLGLDRMIGVSSDLRHDLDVRRQLLVLEEEKQREMRQAQLRAATSPVDRLTSSFDRREVSSDRRPVRERLGDIATSRTKADDSMPDFRKEVDLLNRMEPSSSPHKGTYFQHDDRDKRSSSPERRLSRPERGRFITRGGFRGTRGRGFRGGYIGRGRGYSRGFRGSFSRPYVRGVGIRPRSSFTWKHDKFDDNGHERKKEKKSKSADKKKSKKSSKKSPERSSKSSKRDSKTK